MIDITTANIIQIRAPLTAPHGKIFPATYEHGAYATETRIIKGQPVPCVVVDSVASQANRLELMAIAAMQAGALPIGRYITTLADKPLCNWSVPHRGYDALIRNTTLNGTPWLASPPGQALSAARPHTPDALYTHSMNMALLGAWDSHSSNKRDHAKFARAITSEIVAIHVAKGVRTSSRLSPVGIPSGTKVKVRTDTQAQLVASGGKEVKPGEIGLASITPTIDEGGFTAEQIELNAVLSMIGLRRLRFSDPTAHRVIALLGLYLMARQIEDGLDLRARCLLMPAGPVHLLVDGVEHPLPSAEQLHGELLTALDTCHLPLVRDNVELVPTAPLLALVAKAAEVE